jgi:uncharacterized protein GlcG (DUF336 family)
MVDEALAKAREIGGSENVLILDDGDNLKVISRMGWVPILSIDVAQNKAYSALFGVFQIYPKRPVFLDTTLARVAA